MYLKKTYLLILLFPLFLNISCLYSRATGSRPAVSKTVKVISGSAILKVSGQINENLYSSKYRPGSASDEYFNTAPLINKSQITKNQTINLTAGSEYKFSVLPTEVVTINITSANGDNVEIKVIEFSREITHIIDGTNRLGLSLAFYNN